MRSKPSPPPPSPPPLIPVTPPLDLKPSSRRVVVVEVTGASGSTSICWKRLRTEMPSSGVRIVGWPDPTLVFFLTVSVLDLSLSLSKMVRDLKEI